MDSRLFFQISPKFLASLGVLLAFRVYAFPSESAVLEQRNSPLAQSWIARMEKESNRFSNQKPEVPRRANGALEDARSSLARTVCWAVHQKLLPNDALPVRVKLELEALTKIEEWPTNTPLAMAEWTASYSIGLGILAQSDNKEDSLRFAKFLRSKLVPDLLTIWSKNGVWQSYDSNQRVVIASAFILAERTIAEYNLKPIERLSKIDDSGIANYISGRGLTAEGYAYWRYASSILSLTALNSQGPMPSSSPFATELIAPSGLCANFGDSADGEVFIDAKTGEKSRQAVLNTSVINNEINWENPSVLQKNFINQMVNSEGPWEEDRRFFALAGLCELASDHPMPHQKFAIGNGWGSGQIAVWRSLFPNKPDSYLAVRAMKAGLPHAQMDAGSFIYETDKVRWFSDPGKDDYDFPGYFESAARGRRWENRFCGANGHSTFFVKNVEPNPAAIPELLVNASVKKVSFGTIYGLEQGALTRTFEFLPNGIALNDHFACSANALEWGLITECEISKTDQMVKLTRGTKSLQIITKVGSFSIEAFDESGKGMINRPELKKIMLSLPPIVTDVRIEIISLN